MYFDIKIATFKKRKIEENVVYNCFSILLFVGKGKPLYLS